MRTSILKSNAGRPKAGHSNIRGRISGPIPIPEPDDDEFPMRQPGTGVATPLGNGNEDQQFPLQPPPDGSSAIDVQQTISNTPIIPVQRTESAAQVGPSQASTAPANSPPRRTNRTSTLRYSTVSNGTDTDQSRSAPQRKKSILRSAIGKLFGRRKKSPSNSSISETQIEGPKRSAQHRSEPSALNHAVPKDGEPKRSTSMPVTEYDRALRSHSICADDMIAIESARNSIQVDPVANRRRAATTSTSRIKITSKDFGDIGGLSPRPASTHARGSQAIGAEDPEDIGRAITSDMLTSRRRSRSLSQMQDAVAGDQEARNRSEEIRYWRESYNPGYMSPVSSKVNEDAGVTTLEPSGSQAESPVELKLKIPPQPFTFGTMAGMKITQAASLEERIAILETRNQKLEKLVAQLFQVVPGVNCYVPENLTAGLVAPNPAAYAAAAMQSSSRYGGSSRHSNESFGDGNTFIDSIAPSTRRVDRPTSNSTVRVATSLPTLPREVSGTFTDDHYTTLLALVETERSARQALEAQVTKLKTKVALLSRALQKTGAQTSAATYSTFEYDDGDEEEASSEAFKTPREEQPQHGFGAFGEELVDDDADGSRKKSARTLSLSQLTLGKPPKTKEVGVDL